MATPRANPAVGGHYAQLGLSHRDRLEIVAGIMLALFLGALDQTVVGTALPRIVTDLGGNEYYTWVVTIYLLTSTITVPFYGRLSDVYGRRPFLLLGIGLFLLGSALSGLSQTMWQLVLFRGVQGLGAGALFPISLSVIGDLFSPAERGRYQGLFGAVFGVSFLVGPALGGFLTDTISWHWVFYVNLPVGLLSLYVIWRLLPNVRAEGIRHRFDIAGALVFTIAVALLLIGLTNKQSGEWTDPQVGGLIGLALVGAAIFLLIEQRAAEPIVPLQLFRIAPYALSIVATFFVSFGFFGAVIFVPRWFQVVQGSSATLSGYQMFPLLVGLMGSSILSGQLVARTRRYKAILLAGLAIGAVGFWLLMNLRADTPIATLWLWLFVAGVGLGPTMAVFTIAVQNAVPVSALGTATSNLTFFRQIGGSVGLAIAGTVFGTSLKDQLPGDLRPIFLAIRASLPPAFQAQFDQLAAGGGSTGGLNPNDFTGVGQSFGRALLMAVEGRIPSSLRAPVEALLGPHVPELDAAFHSAFSTAVAVTFAVALVSTLVAFLATLVAPELPLRTHAVPAPLPEAGVAEVELTGEAAGASD